MTAPLDPVGRRAELAANLESVRQDVAQTCRRNDRDPSEVEIVAVTKTFPASDVIHLVELGMTDVAENRDQEAAPKAREVADSGAHPRWHFVGRLQRNKCRSVVEYADLVQSVDRSALIAALDTAALARRRDPLPVLLQLSLDGDLARGGAPESEDATLVEQTLRCKGLRLAGVMSVAPRNWDPSKAFDTLASRVERIRRIAPEATVVSAGMSGDYRTAIAYGATMIRLGAKLLGRRPDVGYPDGRG